VKVDVEKIVADGVDVEATNEDWTRRLLTFDGEVNKGGFASFGIERFKDFGFKLDSNRGSFGTKNVARDNTSFAHGA
jgi:hypothetical protein